MNALIKARNIKSEAAELADSGHPQQAVDNLLEACRLLESEGIRSNDLAEIHYLIANILFNMDRSNEACEHFNKALTISDGKDTGLANRCYLNLGQIDYEKDDYKLALSWFEKISGIKGLDNDQQLYYYRMVGDCYLKLGNPKRGLRYLFKALSIPAGEDWHYATLYYIGCCYYELGKNGKALKYYEESLQDYPDQDFEFKQRTLLYTAYIYLRQKRYEKVIANCDAILKIPEVDAPLAYLYTTLGLAYKGLKKYKEAIDCFEKASSELDKHDEELRNRLSGYLADCYGQVQARG